MRPLAVKLGVEGSTVRERQACILAAGWEYGGGKKKKAVRHGCIIRSTCAKFKRGEEKREKKASEKERGSKVKKLDSIFDKGAEL